MICVSIAEGTADGCIRALEGLELAEIRMDEMEPQELTKANIRRIFSSPLKLIATCRPGIIDEEHRRGILIDAVDSGAAYVDIEVESDDGLKNDIVAAARGKGCKVIVSYHDYKKTPSSEELRQIVEWCFESGADIAKISCMANSEKDNARLFGLLDLGRPLIVIGMGERGRLTRVVAPLLGAVFTYASSSLGKETAPGQIDKARLERIMEELRGI
ncbi:type I 3-dehydroquinate dehydratase [Candidatus Micrarchaeota archaeon]|nr:type I 3-dehydroquinate dehydratase [Candidatus Micrarchaeota archaeon]